MNLLNIGQSVQQKFRIIISDDVFPQGLQPRGEERVPAPIYLVHVLTFELAIEANGLPTKLPVTRTGLVYS